MKFEILGANNEVVRTLELDNASIRIGKNANCELSLDDQSVSRVHAKIEKVGVNYRLSDSISAGGTFIDKKKVEPNKPVNLSSGSILTFGQVSVRVTFDSNAAAEEEDGATVAMEAPSPAQLEAAAVAAAVPAAAAAAAPVPSQAKAAPPAAKNNANPMGGNFGSAFSSGPATTTIIRKKKRPTSFERRFLSERGSANGNLVLEVALVWKDTVLSIKQYEPKAGRMITVGSDKKCDCLLDVDSPAPIVIANCNASNKWELVFNTALSGFVLVGDKKTEFSSASSAEFTVPHIGMVAAGSLACAITGETRAKFAFGDASVLIHYVDKAIIAAPLFGKVSLDTYGPLLASLAIHLAFFSVILFSTNRVDALTVDRIMNASRFANVVEAKIEDEKPPEDIPDEEIPEEEPEESENVGETTDSPFAANTTGESTGNSNGPTLSKSEAASAAQATGLLAQSNAMNSMLAAGLDTSSLDNLDWSSFDSSAAAASAGYGLGTTGTGGGGAGMGGFGGGGFGPGGGGGRGGAIAAAGRNATLGLGSKGEAKPKMIAKNPEVTGSIDKRIIQKVVRQHTGELRACYEREVAKIKGLNGRIVAFWIIAGNGSVTKALIKETTMKNKNVENCITNSIAHWRFPPPKGGAMASVEYPFVFELGGN